MEFFREAARHLKDGGAFFQWLQMYKLEAESLRLLVRTFRRVFPQVHLVRPPGTGEVILAGSFQDLALERFLEAPAGRLLAGTGVEVPADRLAVFVVGPAGVDEWVGLAPALPVSTDSRGEIEYLAARSLYSRRDVARENLALLHEIGGRDPLLRYLPERLRNDVAFSRLLAARKARLGQFAEALATLQSDDSSEARALREEIERSR